MIYPLQFWFQDIIGHPRNNPEYKSVVLIFRTFFAKSLPSYQVSSAAGFGFYENSSHFL